jgi:hypothetical protein
MACNSEGFGWMVCDVTPHFWQSSPGARLDNDWETTSPLPQQKL